jgi:uncharacterized protein
MIVVSDTSCITNLIQINQLNLLSKLYTTIIITPIVKQELQQFHSLTEPDFALLGLLIQSPENTSAVITLMKNLDAGESESIILAEEINADFLLVDERQATKIANARGLTTIGILGVLLLAKQKKHIDFVKPLLNDLKNKTTFRFSNSLLNKLLQLANEQ